MSRSTDNGLAEHQRGLITTPDDALAHGRLGLALRDSGALDRGSAVLRWGTILEPANGGLWGALAQLRLMKGKPGEAARLAIIARALAPSLEAARLVLMQAIQTLGAANDAIEAQRRGLFLDPGQADMLSNFGNLRDRLGQPEQGLRLLDWAWCVRPGLAALLNNRASIARRIGKFGAAERDLRRALLLQPNLSAAVNGLATVRRDLGDAELAVMMCRRGLMITPNASGIWSNLLYAAQYRPGIKPGRLLDLHRQWARAFELSERKVPRPAVRADRPLRLGFASPDFGQHPVGYFTLGLFEHADREKLSIHVYDDRAVGDAVTERLAGAVDCWRRTVDFDDAAWREAVRRDDLDVLVDLAGHTAGGRLLAMAERVAPAQASWAGYVGTNGLPSMDLLIADTHHVPPGSERDYTENVLRLPEGYVSYTPVANPEDDPGEGRGAGTVTFASFNNPAKLNGDVLSLWAELLSVVPEARLQLRYRGLDDPMQAARIRDVFEQAGIAPERLLLEAGGGRLDMLRAYRQVNVALDTFPYSGGLTTIEALWMGVPVVTLPGPTFAGRHSLSHLTVAGQGNWVARDRAEYVAIAADLANREIDRRAIREKLLASPLMDHVRFAEGFHTALRDWLK